MRFELTFAQERMSSLVPLVVVYEKKTEIIEATDVVSAVVAADLFLKGRKKISLIPIISSTSTPIRPRKEFIPNLEPEWLEKQEIRR